MYSSLLMLVPVIVALIALFQSNSFFWYTVICIGLHWFAAGLYKEGESKEGGYGCVSSIGVGVLAMMSLPGSETSLFLTLTIISFICSLIYLGMEDENSPSTNTCSGGSRDTEVWEVRKVRQIKRKRR